MVTPAGSQRSDFHGGLTIEGPLGGSRRSNFMWACGGCALRHLFGENGKKTRDSLKGSAGCQVYDQTFSLKCFVTHAREKKKMKNRRWKYISSTWHIFVTTLTYICNFKTNWVSSISVGLQNTAQNVTVSPCVLFWNNESLMPLPLMELFFLKQCALNSFIVIQCFSRCRLPTCQHQIRCTRAQKHDLPNM